MNPMYPRWLMVLSNSSDSSSTARVLLALRNWRASFSTASNIGKQGRDRIDRVRLRDCTQRGTTHPRWANTRGGRDQSGPYTEEVSVMPIYEYRCPACGTVFSRLFQRLADAEHVQCSG